MEVSGFIGITALGQVTTTIDYRDGLMKFSFDANRGLPLLEPKSKAGRNYKPRPAETS